MDCDSEHNFLTLLELHRDAVIRGNTSIIRDKRKRAWNAITTEFATTDIENRSTEVLQKKWNNIQTRVKEKIRKRQMTGGGHEVKFNENDFLAMKIIGIDNPILSRIPGAKTDEGESTSFIPTEMEVRESGSSTEETVEDESSTQDDSKPVNRPTSKREAERSDLFHLEEKRVRIEEQRLRVEEEKVNIQRGILNELTLIRQWLQANGTTILNM